MKDNRQYIEGIYKKEEKLRNSKIKNKFYQTEFKMNKFAQMKMVATFVLAIGITVGIGYASVVTYQKVWKEPEEYKITYKKIGDAYIVEGEEKILEEEMADCISKDEALKKGNEVLKKFGINAETQTGSMLIDSSKREKSWVVYGGNASIEINATNGEFKSLSIPSTGRDVSGRSTKEEALKVAYDFLNRYQEDSQDYEIVKLNNNMGTEEDSYIWYATFERKYGELFNHYDYVNIGWIPGINEIYSYSVESKKFENNPVELSKEDAIKIAEEKDKQIEPDAQIKEIKADIRIEKMNSDAYEREKFGDEYQKQRELPVGEKTYYITEERVRKVWIVTLKYDKIKEGELSGYSYFVDATTGEIIGGEPWDYFESESDIDQYNYIENGSGLVIK